MNLIYLGLFRLNRGIAAIVVRCAYIVRMHGTKERVGSAIKVKLCKKEKNSTYKTVGIWICEKKRNLSFRGNKQKPQINMKAIGVSA